MIYISDIHICYEERTDLSHTDFSDEELKQFCKTDLSSFRQRELDDYHGLLTGIKQATSKDSDALKAQNIVISAYESGGPCEKLDKELSFWKEKIANRLGVTDVTKDEDLDDLSCCIDNIVEAVSRLSYIYSRLITLRMNDT